MTGARKACHTVKDSIKPQNCGCAQSWLIDMVAIQSPSTDNRRRPGGARPGAGRPSSYTPLVAEQMTAYVKTTAYPSLKHFCECYGYRRATVSAWELQGHRELINALGALRYRQEVDMGKAA